MQLVVHCSVLVLLCVTSLVSTFVAPQVITRPSSIWQGMQFPSNLVVSSFGSVFVTDEFNDRIVEFDGMTHDIINSYRVPINGYRSDLSSGNQPQNLVLDEKSQHEWNLYVTYSYGRSPAELGIFRITQNGEVTQIMNSTYFGYHGLTLGKDQHGNTILYATLEYVNDHKDYPIYIYNTHGQLIQTYDTNTTTIMNPTNMMMDEWNQLYVIDTSRHYSTNNGRIVKLNATDGTVLMSFSTVRNPTTYPHYWNGAFSVAVIPHQLNSNIYMTYDIHGYYNVSNSNIIAVYNASGGWIQDIVITSPDLPNIPRLQGITIHNNTHGTTSIYVVDQANACVIQLDLYTFVIQHIYGSPYIYMEPTGLFVAPTNASDYSTNTCSRSVYVIDQSSRQDAGLVYQLDSVTGFQQVRYTPLSVMFPQWQNQYHYIQDVLVDSRGYMYLLDLSGGYGRNIFVCAPGGGTGIALAQYNNSNLQLSKFAIDATDHIYVPGDDVFHGTKNQSIAVLYYNDTTNTISIIRMIYLKTSNENIGPMAVAAHIPYPSIYIADGFYGVQLRKYDMNGQELRSFPIDFDPARIVVDRYENIYILTQYRQKIIQYPPNGSCPQVIYQLPENGASSSTYWFDVDDTQGMIYVSDYANHRIVVFPISNYTTNCDSDTNGDGSAKSNLSIGALVGIVVGSVVGAIILIGVGLAGYQRYHRRWKGNTGQPHARL